MSEYIAVLSTCLRISAETFDRTPDQVEKSSGFHLGSFFNCLKIIQAVQAVPPNGSQSFRVDSYRP